MPTAAGMSEAVAYRERSLVPGDATRETRESARRNKWTQPLPSHFREKLCAPAGNLQIPGFKFHLQSPGFRLRSLRNPVSNLFVQNPGFSPCPLQNPGFRPCPLQNGFTAWAAKPGFTAWALQNPVSTRRTKPRFHHAFRPGLEV